MYYYRRKIGRRKRKIGIIATAAKMGSERSLDMKALSVRQPYAWFIESGEKDVEYRTWKTDYRGDLLICASTNREPGIVEEFGVEGMKQCPTGVAVCVATLADIQPTEGIWGWILKNPRPVEYFPVKGKLHLFEVDDGLIRYSERRCKTPAELEREPELD